MAMRIDAIMVIKQRLTMRSVVERYGYDIDRRGFICCPLHSEKTPSMKIYDGDRGFHCFGCGEHGDVITFVQKVFGLSFQETLRKIDADFALNIYSEHSYEDLRKSHFEQKALQAKREREKAEQEKADAEYWEAFDEWKRLDDNRRIYAPKNGEELHPLFIESIQKLEHQKYVLDCLDKRRAR
jgi:DNA primase